MRVQDWLSNKGERVARIWEYEEDARFFQNLKTNVFWRCNVSQKWSLTQRLLAMPVQGAGRSSSFPKCTSLRAIAWNAILLAAGILAPYSTRRLGPRAGSSSNSPTRSQRNQLTKDTEPAWWWCLYAISPTARGYRVSRCAHSRRFRYNKKRKSTRLRVTTLPSRRVRFWLSGAEGSNGT